MMRKENNKENSKISKSSLWPLIKLFQLIDGVYFQVYISSTVSLYTALQRADEIVFQCI